MPDACVYICTYVCRHVSKSAVRNGYGSSCFPSFARVTGQAPERRGFRPMHPPSMVHLTGQLDPSCWRVGGPPPGITMSAPPPKGYGPPRPFGHPTPMHCIIFGAEKLAETAGRGQGSARRHQGGGCSRRQGGLGLGTLPPRRQPKSGRARAWARRRRPWQHPCPRAMLLVEAEGDGSPASMLSGARVEDILQFISMRDEGRCRQISQLEQEVAILRRDAVRNHGRLSNRVRDVEEWLWPPATGIQGRIDHG